MQLSRSHSDGVHYIVCRNERQAQKDVADREAIVNALQEKRQASPKSLIGNKGYRSFLKVDKESVTLVEKIAADACVDGIWVLTTNTNLSA